MPDETTDIVIEPSAAAAADAATSTNGLFCAFHSRQCHGLYLGYKRRNSKLDEIRTSPPPCLASRITTTKLVNDTFADLEDETPLAEIHDYLLETYRLLDRVIRARNIHHAHFYARRIWTMDISITVTRALERVTQRTAVVLYKKRQWFQWVRQCQEEYERNRENEKKKVKREAALFKRQVRNVERRMKELREKEEVRRQEEVLEMVYQERVKSEAEEWDPIEDVMGKESGVFIGIIRHFPWLEEQAGKAGGVVEGDGEAGRGTVEDEKEESEAPVSLQDEVAPAVAKSKKKAKKGKKNKAADPELEAIEAAASENIQGQGEQSLPIMIKSDQKKEFGLGPGAGLLVKGTIDNPKKVSDRMPVLLPAAMRAATIEEFFEAPEVTINDLRDVYFFRSSDETDEESDAPEEDSESDSEDDERHWLVNRGQDKHSIPRSWKSKREKKLSGKPDKPEMTNNIQSLMNRRTMAGNDEKESTGNQIDFGELDDNKDPRKKNKFRVKICGRHIYNYPSAKSMSRGGWLHFSIIAKDCSFYRAVELCKSWEEFFELNIEWDVVVRPKIAHLFREGVICISHEPVENIPGQAFAGTEPGRSPDLFFDFRIMINEISFPSTHSTARFSFLRLWSAPHFCPFMIGFDRRSYTSFTDVIGRIWEWKFLPKDMPDSERSAHSNLRQRFAPYQRAFGEKLLLKRDMIIVMGESEEELEMLTTAATFVIQTQPWRLEVDFWKSFANVDERFMDRLKDEWYD
ncbi:hypothetical protein AJ80_08714 [Polytolypa hystricis UAMH7299]|uniref:Uncharacterized protein n=1 Tax=Polytolypa hystricis (strain UAMH7299) TaxID=1447883 RepID=A0A2B7X2Z2_POLH7|nr:hypothetical protein AJ80_08714 [Polytolypa hystricis UAMH7299]